jgi:threonine dehydratase
LPAVSLKNIQAASDVIRDMVQPTPILESIFLSERLGIPVYLKLENLNITGSFKIRGATNAIRSLPQHKRAKGIVAASAGNHAQAVAYVCRHLEIPCHIFMPEFTPLIKSSKTEQLGAQITLIGETLDDAYESALEYEQQTGATMIHPFADADVIAGQGTIGLELAEQVPDTGMIIVPVGGGGMISGIACAYKARFPKTKVIGVQADAYPAMKQSFDAGSIQKNVLRNPTIADGIAVKSVLPINFEMIQHYVDDFVTVSEDQIATAVMELVELNHLLAEGAGAAGVAAIEELVQKHNAGGSKLKSIVVVICGGNIDINLMRRITMKGLIHSGRVMRLRVRISDRPGGLSALLGLIATSKASIIELFHDREFNRAHYHDVEVNLKLETSGIEHQQVIQKTLTENNVIYSVLSD